MHVHAGLMHALTTFAYVIIIGFFWRLYSVSHADTALGRGMGFVY